ncbi:MAG: ABC transporter permease [candidate division NC10 bacterium RIFCSPLOWO2_12_FULL_66_18]|nr:MAG: ABC transporter permease [candidate division NC10 bacterium RIFCSPLOWO2_12_FULL_66_18]
MLILLLFACFFLLLALRVPIAFSLGIVSLGFLIARGEVLLAVSQRMSAAADSFPLLAIPFYILMGKLVNEAGLTDKIFGFAQALVGHIRGGLAHVNILNSMIFAGMSGAAVADVGGMGAMEIKAMVDNGYDVDFSAAVTAASSTIAPIIPPSIAMVVYGVLASTSVGALFLGGVIPGVLVGLFMMAYSYVMAVRRNYPLQPRANLRELWRASLLSIPGLLTPTILLGGIGLGIFTPTEAAVVAVFYTLFLGVLVYRCLGAGDLLRLLRETVDMTAVVVFVMTTASLFAWIMAREQVPQRFAEFILSTTSSPAVVLLLINILGLIMGCFFDGISILVIVVPIFLPILDRLGIDRVHFGVLFVLNTVIGLITPPVGVVLYATVEVAKISFERVVRATLPFLWPMVAALIVVTYVPQVVLVLPRLFGFR